MRFLKICVKKLFVYIKCTVAIKIYTTIRLSLTTTILGSKIENHDRKCHRTVPARAIIVNIDLQRDIKYVLYCVAMHVNTHSM